MINTRLGTAELTFSSLAINPTVSRAQFFGFHFNDNDMSSFLLKIFLIFFYKTLSGPFNLLSFTEVLYSA
jgi:hypothetical protein